jgi:hypothetical protein
MKIKKNLNNNVVVFTKTTEKGRKFMEKSIFGKIESWKRFGNY